MIAAGRPLLAAAQHAREVRDDLTLEQILDMIIAIATIHGDTRYLEPILQAALDGLRPSAEGDGSRHSGCDLRRSARIRFAGMAWRTCIRLCTLTVT